jgi:DNA topoisomerase-1
LPKGLAASDVDLERALGLLSLPREVGKHPEDGEPILAGIGRFGAYVKHGKVYASLEEGDDVLGIGLNRAVTLIAEKKLKPGRGRSFGPAPGRTLGDHPDLGGPIVAKSGRYGPYVSHDGVNATITGDKTADTVTLDEAVALIDARIAAGGGKKRKAPAKAKGKKADAKKAEAETAPSAEKPKAKKAAKPKAKAKAKPASSAGDDAVAAPHEEAPARKNSVKKPKAAAE